LATNQLILLIEGERKLSKRIVSVVILSVLLISMFPSIFNVSQLAHTAPSGLVGYWKFDEGSGTTASDNSGNSNNGILINSPVWVDGRYGKALKFNGVNNFVNVSDSPSLHLASAATVEAWLYIPAGANFAGGGYVLSKDAGNGVYNLALLIRDNYGHVCFGVGTAAAGVIMTSKTTVARNIWTYLGGTYDGSTMKLYVNGQLDSTYSWPGGINTNNGMSLTIGKKNNDALWFNGTIDEVRIYDRALSQEEVQTDMGGGVIRGPSTDNLYIKYYSNDDLQYNALKNDQVDLIDAQLTQAQIAETANNASIGITTTVSPSYLIYDFDINNNATIPTYPNWTSPTSYKKFRQAIALLVNKTEIANDIFNYSTRIDTPIPRPVSNWWVDWSVSQYDSYGNLLGNYPYEYNASLAASYFDQAGFGQGETLNPYYDESFPGSARYLRTYPEGHPKAGQNLDPLIFYIRNDSAPRLQAGRLLRDYLRKMGIPVNAIEANYATCSSKYVAGDYQIYTAGWVFDSGMTGSDWASPDSLAMYTSNDPYNFVHFKNSTYDAWFEEEQSASNLTIALKAALNCQRILVQEAASVWLVSQSYVNGYRDIYGVENLVGGRVDNRWTFLRARSGARNYLRYGVSTPPSLNVITDYYTGSVEDVLDRIYDTLLSYSPYDRTPGNTYGNNDRGGTMPWMAKDWEIGLWQSPYDRAKNLTKLTFYLRDGIYWQDGVELNSSDVKFTIEYLQRFNSSDLYYNVDQVDHVTTPDAETVCVYENVSSVETLDLIGTLPILPKHIFQSITNVTGYTPGAGQGYPANQTLIGSGPWKYVSNNSTTLVLEANRNYFMATPPIADIDLRYNWERGSWVVDAMDATMLGESYGTIGSNYPDAKWNPGCDLNGDLIINGTDTSIISANFNETWGSSAQRTLVVPPTATAITVEPLQNSTLLGQNLTVYVKLENLNMLSGVQFKLVYDNVKLNCLGLALTQIFTRSFLVRNVINQTDGYLWVSVSALSPMQPPASGNLTLATITFNAKNGGSSILDLEDTELAGYRAQGLTTQPINHQVISKGVIISVPTPTGTNVKVAATPNLNLTFPSVTTQGVTTVNVTQPPAKTFVSVLCDQIKTTATYTGSITVQFAYDPTGLSLEQQQAMKIWLWNGTSQTWLDITTSVDTTKHVVSGLSPHFSIFAISSDVEVEGSVTKQGDFYLGTPASPPSPLSGLTVLKYYNITTTTVFSGSITLRITYDNTAIPSGAESLTSLWLWNTTSWVDITTSVDTTRHIVSGLTPHLSIFAIASLPPRPQGMAVSVASNTKTVVGKGLSMNLGFTVTNQGDFPLESLNIIVYANSTQVTTFFISSLNPNSQSAFSFMWNTANFAKGNYTISVSAWPVPGSTDTSNRPSTGWVIVAMIGDITGPKGVPDGRVDMYDVALFAAAFGSKPGDRRWNPNCDLTGPKGVPDGHVKMDDIALVAGMFGKKAS
jgi:ABC-type transport system substrate-binding protein